MAGLPILAIGADTAWRARMRRVFAVRPEVHWLGAYANGEARPGADDRPALLLLDGDDPQTSRARRRPNLPTPARICFFRHPDSAALAACLRAHAGGCLDKQVSADALVRAVAAAESGMFVASPGLLAEVLRGQHDAIDSHAEPMPNDHGFGLTGRQREIVACLATGLSNKEIARKLGVSPETVKAHLHAMFERGGVHGRVALLAAVQLTQGNGGEPMALKPR